MSPEPWDDINLAAEMDGVTVGEFLRLHAWAACKEQLGREAERKRQAAEKPPPRRISLRGALSPKFDR
jgi:hypothetical protein